MDFLDKVYYGNTFFEWLLAFAIMIGVAVLGRLVYWLLGNIVKRITRRTKTKIDDIIIDMAEEPLVFAIVIAGIWYALKTLNLPPWTAEWIGRVYYVLIIINIGWLVSRLFDALIEQYLVPLVEKTEGDLDDQLLPIVRKGVRLAIWAITIIIALNNAGYDVGALLAGVEGQPHLDPAGVGAQQGLLDGPHAERELGRVDGGPGAIDERHDALGGGRAGLQPRLVLGGAHIAVRSGEHHLGADRQREEEGEGGERPHGGGGTTMVTVVASPSGPSAGTWRICPVRAASRLVTLRLPSDASTISRAAEGGRKRT